MEAMVELKFGNGKVVEQEGYSFIRATGEGILTRDKYVALERECVRSARINNSMTEEEKKTEGSGQFSGKLLPIVDYRILWSRVIIHRRMKTRFLKEKGKFVTDEKGNKVRDTNYSPKPLKFKEPVTKMQRYNGKHYLQVDTDKGKLWREMETGILYSNGTYTKRIKKGLPAKPYHARV
jgi:hypothetical protein